MEIDPAQIGLDAPLFGSGLGLDSVDALGIVATLEVRFGLEIVDGDMALFRSVNTIVDFILAHQGWRSPHLISIRRRQPPRRADNCRTALLRASGAGGT
ncbi:MAG: acyl carrier protein [Candidatus Eisenbacteria bacterium]|nr:acyl carrier protein [Candidatus Eisenbacteria bacterium]